jgi:hypothetical protein
MGKPEPSPEGGLDKAGIERAAKVMWSGTWMPADYPERMQLEKELRAAILAYLETGDNNG